MSVAASNVCTQGKKTNRIIDSRQQLVDQGMARVNEEAELSDGAFFLALINRRMGTFDT